MTTLARNALEKKVLDPPMNKHAATTIETFLYEGIAAGEVFDDVFIFYVVDLYHLVLLVSQGAG